MLTTSEKATERDPRSMQKAALYLLSTIVAIKVQENAPRSPDNTKYDLLRYPKRGIESLPSLVFNELIHKTENLTE